MTSIVHENVGKPGVSGQREKKRQDDGQPPDLISHEAFCLFLGREKKESKRFHRAAIHVLWKGRSERSPVPRGKVEGEEKREADRHSRTLERWRCIIPFFDRGRENEYSEGELSTCSRTKESSRAALSVFSTEEERGGDPIRTTIASPSLAKSRHDPHRTLLHLILKGRKGKSEARLLPSPSLDTRNNTEIGARSYAASCSLLQGGKEKEEESLSGITTIP